MRIGIDCRMAGTGEGIARYLEELVANLALIDFENDYFLLVNTGANVKFKNQNEKFKTIPVKSRYYSFMEQTYFIWELWRLKLDLMHFPNFNAPIFYPGRFVVTIHDIIHHRYPGRKKARIFHRLAYRVTIWAAIKRAAVVVAVSEATRQDIIKVFREKPEKIKVIYEGAGLSTRSSGVAEPVLARHNITKPFLLFVGVWRQYKNLPRLAAAFDIVRGKYQIDAQLVLVGKVDDFYPEIKTEVMSIRHADDIRALGFVTETDLGALYRSAKIFVLPSLMEGFGLIGVEAQAAGASVAASDIPVLHEVLGNGAVFFDPASAEDMAEKIAEIWQNNAHRQALEQAALQNAGRFDWQNTARETLNVYNKVIL
ncbi:MAG: hypothetical protein A2846_02495 [Candidatus Doudnabacteria bacterium RIFCSPHIGHO2_01_FULL_49_9]|uniref:Glycosyl transferase family 1 domain-containing protein n=1 Tax=Candidatus Doudnabacteria bacterium RIFCSPHIGHO2_01_FULL_49_9 TaxID=1817827 RepID=A0A1F5P2X4_9BACT|nr:MAG: hypothetical protein A2846_02495 [Candidatus Doudnabacteria bacterium RIFCSPHIGHO2_01_FULL_49_9]